MKRIYSSRSLSKRPHQRLFPSHQNRTSQLYGDKSLGRGSRSLDREDIDLIERRQANCTEWARPNLSLGMSGHRGSTSSTDTYNKIYYQCGYFFTCTITSKRT
ncbi:hypothetical protein DVH05_012961 [Phytophthora capsici]|nr:hypothetical protein DVH05_012961 [Phytophthora capsici]